MEHLLQDFKNLAKGMISSLQLLSISQIIPVFVIPFRPFLYQITCRAIGGWLDFFLS